MDFKKPLSFDEFQKASREAWEIQAQKELKKDSIESLQWKTNRNILSGPYYDKSTHTHIGNFNNHLNPPHEFRQDARWWENRQLITYSDETKTNLLILEALEGGADGIIIKANNPKINFEKLLREVKLAYCSVSFITNEAAIIEDYLRFSQSLSEYQKISGSVFWESTEAVQAFLQKNIEAPENFRYLGFSQSGKTQAEDQIATIVHLVQGFNDNIQKTLLKKAVLSISIDEDYFQGIALVKAARIAMYQAVKSFDVPIAPEDIFVQVISGVYKNENYGPHENMLKSTTAGMAAIIGGCNSLVVIPENEDNPLMRRVARNVSHILKEESYLGKITDPAAGSYFLEHLTESTLKNLWDNFQERVSQNI